MLFRSTGSKGGSICTSGNAKKIMSHYLSAGRKILFMPDKNLGINTARSLGLTENDMCLVSQDGLVPADCKSARVFLWDGYCPVHLKFTPEQVLDLRAKYPDIALMVHPECVEEVVGLSNSAASTEGMANEIARSPSGSVLGVGTEYRLDRKSVV